MPAPEFCRPIAVSTLPAEGIVREISADPEERAALARRFGIVAIASFDARLRVTPLSVGGAAGARVMGRFSARVRQTCVVTLEDFDADVAEDLRLDLLPGGDVEEVGEAVLDPEEDVEPLEGDVLDLGELVAQYLSLALDPHPRRPGVNYGADAGSSEEPGETGGSGPFAMLGELRRKL
jgi:hypothetical protein